MSTITWHVHFAELPVGLVPSATNRSDTYRLLVRQALNKGLSPVLMDVSSLPTGTIRLFSDLADKIETVAKDYGLDMDHAFTGLCAAAINVLQEEQQQRPAAADVLPGDWVPTVLKGDIRPAQMQYKRNLMNGLRDKKIVLAEASTGVGKGRAMMAAAVVQAREGKGPVIVATPTIAVLTQVYKEYEELEISDVKVAIRPGRTEFVDDRRLRDFVEHADIVAEETASLLPENIQAIKEWVSEGAAAITESALVSAMKTMGIRPAWLMDDFREIAGEFPVDDFRLTSDSDPGCESLALLKDYCVKIGEDADIILCSHSMLALGQKTLWTALPKPQVLFIDEAHKFEQTVAQINSCQLSLFSLRWRLARHKRDHKLKSGTVAAKALKVVGSLIPLCQALEDSEKPNQAVRIDECNEHISPDARRNVLSQIFVLQNLLKSKTLNGLAEIKEDRATLSSLVKSLEGSDRSYIAFSPTKRYPSIVSGASSMAKPLRHIWNSAIGGVVLASATLYIPDRDDRLKCDYVCNVLSVPTERVDTPAPIEAAHVYSIPTLHYPSPDKCKELAAPSIKDRQYATAENLWLSNLAREIFVGPATTAVGGTLILCTSYVQTAGLAQKLRVLGVSADRIVEQISGQKFEAFRQEFIARHKKGLRPIFVALGGAWTGLDLADKDFPDGKDAEKDLLLTDLVVARAPIGLNRSNPMQARVERRGTDPIAKEALLMFKQGLGRLIRREGVTDRHLWVMEGRLWLTWKGMDYFTAAARAMLGKYERRSTF